MAYNMNQFGLTDQPGQTMSVNPDTLAVKVTKDLAAASYYVPGDVVKVVAAEAGDAIPVVKITTGDVGLGVVLSNPKKSKFFANDMVEIGLNGTIVTMVAGTDFNRGPVAYNASTGKIAATTGVKIGDALDIASAAGDIVRVRINTSANSATA